mmetsp:Transcript_4483/g.5131  ORF Transcript_4483/g.5131 Transcript_4483/m.5131 type:complete len:586 (-) Transcript_4483:81-1838(-)
MDYRLTLLSFMVILFVLGLYTSALNLGSQKPHAIVTTDVKNKKTKLTKEAKIFKGISNNVVSRLAKAAKEAAISRKKELSTKENSKEGEEYDLHEEITQNLSSITNLNNVIDEELLRPTDGYRPSRETDSIRVLLKHNCDQNNHIFQKSFISSSTLASSSSKKRKKNNRNLIHPTYDVAIVFARPRVDNKITIEYVFRLVSLAKAMKFERYKPNLVCFCGPSSSSTSMDTTGVSVTSTGVEFFRHICSVNDISLKEMDLCEIPHLFATGIVPQYDNDESCQTLLDQNPSSYVPSSWSPSLLSPVVRELVGQHYIEKWLEESNAYESEMDEYGEQREQPRKKIHIHWKLFSTEYHLCNFNDIHIRSPRQSPLARLVHDLQHAASSQHYRRGIIQTSWSFHYSTYPYVISSNRKKMKEAFLGKCYLMAQSLVPLLVNLRGVAENSEFFQRDNYRALVATRRSLATLLEQMNVAYQHNRERQTATMMIPPTLKVQLKKQTSGSSTTISSIEIHLESALLSLGRCCDLVRPAGTFSAQSVSRQEWIDALVHLQDFMARIECSCDPDRSLSVDQWDIKLIENQPQVETLS